MRIKMRNKNQLTPFFDINSHWKNEWQDMPEFIQEDLTAFRTISINFRNKEYFVEIKSLSSVDVFIKTKEAQAESLEGQIDLESQIESGKRVASTVRVEQPYLKHNKEQQHL